MSLNDQGEIAFLSELSPAQRKFAEEIVNQFELVDLIDLFLNGPTVELQKTQKFNYKTWQILLRATLLTRLSQFRPNQQYPCEDLDFLLKISLSAYRQAPSGEEEKLTLQEMVQKTAVSAPTFSRWLKHVAQLKKHCKEALS
jgi:hypothetical protein